MKTPVAFLALSLLAVGCKPRADEPAPGATPAAHDSGAGSAPVAGHQPAPGAGPRLVRRGGTDVTFYVVSDTHFGYGYPDDLKKLSADPIAAPVGLEKDNLALLRRVNTMEGRPYPAEVGGTITGPRGLLVTGDLTEWGRKEEWERFLTVYGPQARDGGLRLPLFEVVGNHDHVPGPWVEQQVAARHGGRFYAWDWDDVHFVALGEAPDDEGLAFLSRDLSRVDLDVPLVVLFHRCLLGPWSDDNWFGDGNYRDRLAQILEGHSVRAIFHRSLSVARLRRLQTGRGEERRTHLRGRSPDGQGVHVRVLRLRHRLVGPGLQGPEAVSRIWRRIPRRPVCWTT